MTRKPASLGPFGKKQLFLCQGWDGTNPVVGTFDGHIYRRVGYRHVRNPMPFPSDSASSSIDMIRGVVVINDCRRRDDAMGRADNSLPDLSLTSTSCDRATPCAYHSAIGRQEI